MYTLDSFRLDLRRSVAPPNHIWVASGRGTVAPLVGTVCGAAGFFSPPVAAPDASLSFAFTADGHPVPDCGSLGKDDVGLLLSGAEWRPDRIARRGTYHQDVGGHLISFAVESELAAFASRAGFAVRIRARNRGSSPLALRLDATAAPGHPREVPLGPEWQFSPPSHGNAPASPRGAGRWATPDGVRCTLLGDVGHERRIAPGEEAEWCVGLDFESGAAPPANSAALLRETHAVWERRVAHAAESLPELITDLPGLDAYYRRCLASGLVCLWENPAFVVSPFPATSGLDGGSLCCYPWDASGYAARFLVALLGDGARDLLRAQLASHMERHICMSLSGEGQGGCSYSYSLWSALNLLWAIATQLGGVEDLFDGVLGVFLADEKRLPDIGDLKDYGVQRNLLEMRSCGYEHVVPSPNAERAWGFDRLADIAESLGRSGAAEWRAKASRIREAIRHDLWDETAGWFRCRHSDHDELVYSVQAFDALRFGACTPAMQQALVSHVRDGAFLGRFGVSSVSAEDAVHYELNDPDWSGGGAYSGEGPQLAETLWCCGEADRAWDVLSRHFWMGEMLPYIPQEHYCDRPAVPAHKRANIIAGAAGAEAVLHGMAGLEARLDGTLRIAPSPHPGGFVELRGIRHRGRRIDLRFEPGRMAVACDGSILHDGPVRDIAL